MHRARPSSTSLQCPRLRAATGVSATSVRPTSSSISSTLSSSSVVARDLFRRSLQRRASPFFARSATKKCSETVNAGKISTRWKVLAMPSRALR